jgi:hypothetical protein
MLQQGQSRVANDIQKCFDHANTMQHQKLKQKDPKQVAKVAKIPTSRRTWVSSPTNIAKTLSQETLKGGRDAADPTCPADDSMSISPVV